MTSWISANWGTLLVCGLLIALVVGIILKMVRDKRQGRSQCSHGCQNCAMHGQCQMYKKQ